MFVARGTRGLDHIFLSSSPSALRADCLGFNIHCLVSHHRMYMIARRPLRVAAFQGSSRLPQRVPQQALVVSPMFSLVAATAPRRWGGYPCQTSKP
jgi:hypothetical protein